MNNLFYYLGDSALPYRTIMANHTNFTVGEFNVLKNRVVIAEQTHSANVHDCLESDCGAGFDDHCQIPDCDALVTNLPNQFLLIRTADCTPILLYDETTQSIGAVHSGREGTRKDVAGATVEVLKEQYSAQPAKLKAWIGAGICQEHYPVSDEIWHEFFTSCKEHKIKVDESIYPNLDIQSVIYQQLINSGLKPGHINKNTVCTFESENHFSFRRDGTHNRQINIIGMLYGKHYL